jgi:hypothetical protein
MFAFDQLATAMLFFAAAKLIGAIWPHGVFR